MNVDRAAIIKQTVDPRELVRRYMGQPNHEKGHKLWYKSPFRSEERTASFMVDEEGCYDFGTSEYYDVISFVMRWFNCSFLEACGIIERDYGIQSNPFITNEVAQELKKMAEHNKLYTEQVKTWHNEFSIQIVRLWKKSIDEIEKTKNEINFFDGNRYAELLDVNVKLEGLIEYLDGAEKFEEIEKIYQRRGELEDVFGRYKKVVLQI